MLLAFLTPTTTIGLLILGVLIFGRRLPETGRSLGQTIIQFKKGMRGLEDEIEARTGGFIKKWEVIPGSRRIEALGGGRVLRLQVKTTVALLPVIRKLSDIKKDFLSKVSKPAFESLKILRESGWNDNEIKYSGAGLFGFWRSARTSTSARSVPPASSVSRRQMPCARGIAI